MENILLMNQGYDIEHGETEEGIQFKRIGHKSDVNSSMNEAGI